jgi:hypothetical protein
VYAKAAFGKIVHKTAAKNIIEICKELESEKVTDIILVVGSDRVVEFKKILNNYNGKEFNFDSIDVVSAGERDQDAEGIAGMSASKMRSFVKSNKMKEFMDGAPNAMSLLMKRKMFFDVKNNLKEQELITMKKFNELNEEFKRELNEENSMYEEAMSEFVTTVLSSAVATHIMHLRTRSYSVHEALGKFYNSVHELVDNIVETYQGKHGMIMDYPPITMIPSADPLSYMLDLKDYIGTVRMNLPSDSEIQNEIDALANAVNSTIYKLNYLS